MINLCLKLQQNKGCIVRQSRKTQTKWTTVSQNNKMIIGEKN